MKLGEAFDKLKTGGAEASLRYFFCESGEDGKPILLLDRKAIPAEIQKGILSKAKKPARSSGEMTMDAQKELLVTPKGTPPGSQAKGVQTAARNANAMVFSGITILKPGPEDSAVPDPTLPGGKVLHDAAGMSPERRDALKNLTVKKYPDVLLNAPGVAAVLAKKQEIAGRLNALLQTPGVTEEEVAALETNLEKIDEALEGALEGAQRKLNETGLNPQPLRPQYQDEEKKVGWRVDNAKPTPPAPAKGETPEAFAARQRLYEQQLAAWQEYEKSDLYEQKKNAEHIVTKHFSEEEKQRSALRVNELGQVVNPNGELVTDKTEFVMDAEDGEMYRFKADRGLSGKVVPLPGKEGYSADQVQNIHHSSVLGGKEVATAGKISVEQGQVTRISNVSGHYRPGVAQMIQSVEVLIKKGALLDKEWVGIDGKPLTGPAAEVSQRVMELQKRLMNKLREDPAANVETELQTIAKAKAVLGKLGAGPSRRISETMVEFLDIKKEMTGGEIKGAVKEAKANALTAEDFLTTGGGNQEQAAAKGAMHDELEEKLRKKRDGLDVEADIRASAFAPSADPDDDELTSLAAELEGQSLNHPTKKIPKETDEKRKANRVRAGERIPARTRTPAPAAAASPAGGTVAEGASSSPDTGENESDSESQPPDSPANQDGYGAAADDEDPSAGTATAAKPPSPYGETPEFMPEGVKADAGKQA